MSTNRTSEPPLFATLKHLKTFLVDHQVNAVEIDMYVRDLTSQFYNTIYDFQHVGSFFSFLMKPESRKDLNLPAFEWMDIEDFQMQPIDFKTTLLWTSKFVDLQKLLEAIENKQKNILTC